ncbi:MAG: GAF domain-containing protein, partial [Candidatus Limnocylindria bacterium]
MTADAELLKNAVREVARLLQADGAMVYLVDEASGELRFAHDAGITNREARRLIRDLTLPVGVGMFGTAVAAQRLTVTDDYPADRRFPHSEVADRIVRVSGMRSMAVMPLLAGGRAVGALGAYSSRPAAFSAEQIALLRALGDHAAAALANQRLVDQLAASEERYRTQARELEHRVATQQTLHRIAARITAIRDPEEALQQVVDGAKRLLGSDGAHLTLRDPQQAILRPHVMAGGMNAKTRAWLETQEFPIDGGLNGLAAELGEPVWTTDYLVDPRIPHTDDDQAVARRMGLRGMAVAPLRAPGGEVFGTLAISHQRPRETTGDEIELLQGLADTGAIAIANARLYEQLTESGRRYRFIVDNSPDLIWTVDRDGSFTYLSETCRSLVGWAPEEMVGRHLTDIVAPESRPDVLEHWQRVVEDPTHAQQYRLTVLHRDGSRIPMEINGLGTVVDGEFAGGHGSVRDIRERVQLETDLRRQAEALERVVEVQRTLGEIARRIVEVDDAAETLQQVVDASKRLLGSDGAHLTLMNDEGTDLVPMVLAGDTDPRTRAWLRGQRFPVGGGINGLAAQTGRPAWTDDYPADPRIPHDPDDDSPHRLQLGAAAVAPLRGAGGEVVGTLAITYAEPRRIDPRDVALLEELAGQGAIAARNARLYQQLRDSERRYRFLVDHSPDQIYEIDAEGRFTYLSEASELFNGWRPAELIGQPFTSLVAPDDRERMEEEFRRFAADPSLEQRSEFRLLHRDGRLIPVETVGAGTTQDGSFAGIHGSTRDVSERARLEASLRQQAVELARSAEAQRALASIAAEISSIRDPGAVLRRTVDEARRLLGADHAVIDQFRPEIDLLHRLSREDLTSILADVHVSPGLGVAGAAIAEG